MQFGKPNEVETKIAKLVDRGWIGGTCRSTLINGIPHWLIIIWQNAIDLNRMGAEFIINCDHLGH